MRKFTCTPNGEVVDLDDPETYSHLPEEHDELDDLMFEEIGKAMVYMNYFYPDVFNDSSSGTAQRKRIEVLIKDFAENRKHNYHRAIWYQERIFLFQDETENMC